MNKSNEIPILAWATLTGTIIFNLITFVWHDSWVQTIYCLRLSVMNVQSDHCSKFSNLSNGKKKPEKNQGFNGIRTRDLRVAGALLYQLSYEATHWERGQFIEFISPVRSKMMWSIWNNSFLNCGCRWKWRMIIAVNLSNWKEEATRRSRVRIPLKPRFFFFFSGFFLPIA